MPRMAKPAAGPRRPVFTLRVALRRAAGRLAEAFRSDAETEPPAAPRERTPPAARVPCPAAPDDGPPPGRHPPGVDHFLFRASGTQARASDDPAPGDPDPDPAPWITDFDPVEEAIELVWHDADGADPPDLSITVSEWATELRLGSMVVARLDPSMAVGREDVRLVRAA